MGRDRDTELIERYRELLRIDCPILCKPFRLFELLDLVK